MQPFSLENGRRNMVKTCKQESNTEYNFVKISVYRIGVTEEPLIHCMEGGCLKCTPWRY